MNIVFFTKSHGRIASLDIGRKGLFFIIIPLIIALPGVFLYTGYKLAYSDGEATPASFVTSWHKDLQKQRQELDRAVKHSEENMNALAQQLGNLKTHVIRVDALGERLTKMAKLDNGEFNFDSPPALGGPATGSDPATINVAEFVESFEKLSRQIEDRERQLNILESMLMNRNLQAEVYPAGQPVKRGWISSFFGMRNDPFTGRKELHKGIDFAGRLGSEVVAVAAGVVTWIGEKSGYGKTIELNHGNGYVTRYGHNDSILVSMGDKVEKGQTLALMWSSGRSTGPHVHFEVIRNGKTVNPAKYIKATR
jgi:murein DD-endopeptidase MepM/ murein hydrolase activator NlpD